MKLWLPVSSGWMLVFPGESLHLQVNKWLELFEVFGGSESERPHRLKELSTLSAADLWLDSSLSAEDGPITISSRCSCSSSIVIPTSTFTSSTSKSCTSALGWTSQGGRSGLVSLWTSGWDQAERKISSDDEPTEEKKKKWLHFVICLWFLVHWGGSVPGYL